MTKTHKNTYLYVSKQTNKNIQVSARWRIEILFFHINNSQFLKLFNEQLYFIEEMPLIS